MSDLLEDLKKRSKALEKGLKPLDPKKPPPEIANLPEELLNKVSHEKLKRQVAFFRPPVWVGRPPKGVHLEVTKDGAPMKPLLLDTQPYIILGREPVVADHLVEHPSTGRAHCVLCYRPDDMQYFLVDNNSTNGTFIVDQFDASKQQKLTPMKFQRLNYGDRFAIGLSTRMYTLRKKAPTRPDAAGAPMILKDRQDDPRKDPITDPSVPTGALAEEDAMPEGEDQEDKAVILLERHLRHILIKHRGIEGAVSKNPKNKGEAITRSEAEAMEHAKMVREALTTKDEETGELPSFGDLASEFSECATAKRGGDLGVVKQDSFLPEFETAGFALLPGEISKPVATPLGIHVILRVLEAA